MNIVNSGNRYQVYGEEVRTFHSLPAKSYNIGFSPMSGFFLTDRPNMTNAGEKIYGDSYKKVNKVIQSYKAMKTKNFGVLLSGPKGIGKSMFIRSVSEKAVEEGLPVIIVDQFIPGISKFIASIDQDCVVVFDEFEKKFRITEDENPQDDMLSLFDGTEGGHKLFLATCNETRDISEYLINRPGRFHYHININSPSRSEIEEYLKDHVDPKYEKEVDAAVPLCDLVGMPYDHLRAIAFDLNQGYSLKDTMRDLNISKGDEVMFDITAYTKDGETLHAYFQKLDLSSESWEWISFTGQSRSGDFIRRDARICPRKVELENGVYVFNEDRIRTNEVYDYDDFITAAGGDSKKASVMAAAANKNAAVVKLVLKRRITGDYGKYMQGDDY